MITGGQMKNKGAQAMTFTVIDEMKKIYPKNSVIMLSSYSGAISEEDIEKYNIINVSFILRLRMAMSGWIFNFFNRVYNYKKYKLEYKATEEELHNYFKNADCLVDISGFALSSQMGFQKSILYLLGISSAKKYNVPVYLFPQSFGPFDYKKLYMRKIIYLLMKKYLKYPKIIYAREYEGFRRIQKYNENVKLSYDLVLQSRNEINSKNIFRSSMIPNKKLPNIEKKSVAIIPNEKTFIHGNAENILQIYNIIIRSSIGSGMYVYLFSHSNEDDKICEKLKNEFLNEVKVIHISDEYNCIELQKLIKDFMFVIASRYHSIVHAYKCIVPVIALGWAEKYKELLCQFEQEKYQFDTREKLDQEKIICAICDMRDNIEKNRIIIRNKLDLIQKNNIFDEVKVLSNKLKS